jgi:hypothetical protein
LRKIDLDPSCRLPLSSKGYQWFIFLERTIKTKESFKESILDELAEDLHGNFRSHPNFGDLDHLWHIEHGSFYRLKSPDLDCIFWQRTKTIFEIVKVLCTQDRKIMLLNHKIYR